MRICLYTATAHPKLGGQEAVVDSLARHYTKLGHRAVVLAQRPRLPLRPRDHELPYPVARHPRFFSTRHFVGFYRRWLLKLHARERFDVIHCHDVYPTGYLAVLCREELKIPVILTSHGGDVREGNVRVSKPGMRPRYARAVAQADALISIGNFTEQGYLKLGADPSRIVTIPNGIDLAPFAKATPRPPGLDPAIEQGQYVLFLGRLSERKGVDVLIDAMARLPGRACVIAGSGDDAASLQARAANAGMANRVFFVGRVEGDTKTYLLQNAACVAMPSRVWEAFPLVLLEAFAAGKPVVGSDVPGINDFLREDQTGLLVPQDSPAAMAEAISSLFQNLEHAAQLGDNARKLAQDYSWESVTRRHVELYERLKV